jgi:uncharacterized ion transporter superfamily protein YfcC
MKFGWMEIVLIIFVIIAVVVIARIVRPGRIASQNEEEDDSDAARKSNRSRKNRHPAFMARTGIALVVAGGIALIAGASMLKWVFHNYVLSAILIVCGVIIFVLSRRIRQ